MRRGFDLLGEIKYATFNISLTKGSNQQLVLTPSFVPLQFFIIIKASISMSNFTDLTNSSNGSLIVYGGLVQNLSESIKLSAAAYHSATFLPYSVLSINFTINSYTFNNNTVNVNYSYLVDIRSNYVNYNYSILSSAIVLGK